MFAQINLKLPAAIFALLCLALVSPAAEPDPRGTWSWTFETPSGDSIQQKLKLKLEGEKLTGTITGRGGNEIPIQEAKLNGKELSFQVVRERDGNKITAQYRGEIKGDGITGKWTSNFGGEERTRDWVAKRESGKEGELTGDWKYSFTTSGGQTFDPTLKLKQDGETVTGVIVFNENEFPISDGKIKDGDLTFKVERERDGTKFTSRYQGKVEKDTIKGKINSNWGGTDRTYDFEAKRQGN